MQLQAPFTAIAPSVDGDVLSVLTSAFDDFTTARLARLIPHRSISGIRNAAERLAEQGVVIAHTVGRLRVYRLNENHVLADALRAIAGAKQEVLTRMSRSVESWEYPPLFGALFGSAARGEMTAQSDIDVFLLCPDGNDLYDWSTPIGELEQEISGWTGSDARVIEIHENDLHGAAHRALVSEVLRDGVRFTGDPLLLREALVSA